MNLMSISKPAVGLYFDGTLTGIMNVQAFMTANGFRITSMSMGTYAQPEADGALIFQINMTYTKIAAEGEQSNPTMAATILQGYVVYPEGATLVEALTEQQFEANYTTED